MLNPIPDVSNKCLLCFTLIFILELDSFTQFLHTKTETESSVCRFVLIVNILGLNIISSNNNRLVIRCASIDRNVPL